MPVRLRITKKDGSALNLMIPLDVQRVKTNPNQSHTSLSNLGPFKAWPWVEPTYLIDLPFNVESIRSVEIDPDGYTADVQLENNVKMLP
jgi:hypothetical protein